jgi:lipid-A-disaccharide synthase
VRYYIIAGEASGDLHGSNLMKELRKLDPAAEFRFWGGDLMKAQGGDLVKHYRDLAFMGFTEVIMNLRTIFRNLDTCKADILQFKPDAVILIDYPGFNLRIAEFAHENKIKVFYYISPQVWAWKQSRVHKIKRIVDKMFVILPFEKDFYKKFEYDVTYVGHPLLDAINSDQLALPGFEAFREKNGLQEKPVIALLPGSRKQEIETMLPLMLKVTQSFPGYQFVIGAAPSVSDEFYKKILGAQKINIIKRQTYALLRNSCAALVTSGTATLETALFGVPQVVCYKGGWISYMIAKQLVKVDFISLVNLIMGREVVKELIQDDLTVPNLKTELEKILDDTHRTRINADLDELKNKLGLSGASALAAVEMFRLLKK